MSFSYFFAKPLLDENSLEENYAERMVVYLDGKKTKVGYENVYLYKVTIFKAINYLRKNKGFFDSITKIDLMYS